jgi:hypothetical protein
MPKKYTIKHTSQKALDAHIAKIEARGAEYRLSGLNLTYWFPGSEKQTDDQKQAGKYTKKRMW